MHVCACAHTRMHSKSLQLCLTLLRALLNPGIKPVYLMSPASAGGFCTTSATCLGIFNWSIVDLQSCVNFSYMCTQTHTHTFLYTHTHTHTHTFSYTYIHIYRASLWLSGNKFTWNTGDVDSLPRSGRPLEEGMQPTAIFLPGKSHGQKSLAGSGKIPWTEEPGRLCSIGSQRVRHDWSDWACTYLPTYFQILFH